ncbi:MAG: peptidylprolyl isomerase [Gaiellaceae bacterium]|jgi:foldase protein PrsA
MRIRRFIALSSLAVVVAATLAACGTAKKQEVPANAIAVVGNQVVLRSQYDSELARLELEYKQAKKAFPAIGSSAYQTLRDGIVSNLVFAAGVMQRAADMGVKVTSAEVDASLTQLIVQSFGGSQSKYKAELKKEHLTEAQLKDALRRNLISQRVQMGLAQDIKVSSSDIKKYYDEHKSSYQVGESRAVSHILVGKNDKALADRIYQQLKAGANFAKLAKKYSLDSSKTSGGSLGVQEKNKLVAPFANVLFTLKTGTFSKPVKTIYGWHIILATGPIKPPHTISLKAATAGIQQTLLSPKQTKAINDWVAGTKKYIAANTSYAPGFAPAKPSSSAVATTTT